MMADSIESATRVLQEPNAKRLRNLVEKIIQNKQEEGQLDESPLTLAEITILKEAFANSLASIHHQRIEYPTSKHLTKSPQKTAGTEPIKIKDEEQIELEDMSQE